MKTILIDLWGTLITNPQLAPIDEIIKLFNLNLKHEELTDLCNKKGLFSKKSSSLKIWESIMKELGFTHQEGFITNKLWLESSTKVQLYPKTVEFLQELKKQKYTLVLASAIDKDSFEILKKDFLFEKYFDYILPTYTMGIGKSIDYYTRICSQLQIKPYETMMIGDNITYDILPAHQANLNVIFLKREPLNSFEKSQLPVQSIVCGSYEEILKLLKKS